MFPMFFQSFDIAVTPTIFHKSEKAGNSIKDSFTILPLTSSIQSNSSLENVRVELDNRYA
jgi:hypothetical protein